MTTTVTTSAAPLTVDEIAKTLTQTRLPSGGFANLSQVQAQALAEAIHAQLVAAMQPVS